MKQFLLLLQLMAFFSACYSYTVILYYECTYKTITGETTITKTCDACCEHDCCPQKPFDGESLAIILCCSIGILVILLVAVYVAVRWRRRRIALVQARNREITTRIAARDLAALIFLTSPRPKASAVSSSLADPPHYDNVINGEP